MKHTIGYALIVFAAMTSASVASSGTNPTSSGIGKVPQGHGSASHTAESTSNPDTSYQVLDNSQILKTNSHPRQRASWAGR